MLQNKKHPSTSKSKAVVPTSRVLAGRVTKSTPAQVGPVEKADDYKTVEVPFQQWRRMQDELMLLKSASTHGRTIDSLLKDNRLLKNRLQNRDDEIEQLEDEWKELDEQFGESEYRESIYRNDSFDVRCQLAGRERQYQALEHHYQAREQQHQLEMAQMHKQLEEAISTLRIQGANDDGDLARKDEVNVERPQLEKRICRRGIGCLNVKCKFSHPGRGW
ncbi:uncharacterized protein N0V89_011782 [Didymosphaeria variabile]|uniref:C3H1-type domain-containing protein n=1 Tax=Didymosphaeria variabile TaxID=1932322 RepID=A0A9W9C6Q4_9PLEO|nr:uncharacterized protein N0V89_011782 [Didymosphaeria variabile]KAJ4345648.1 hypothetical protein N0V89_011782 [Didymosphaeria variabile]